MTFPLRPALAASLGLMALAGCEGDSTEYQEARILSPAEANCILGTETRTGRRGITVSNVETAEAGTSVSLNVPGTGAEWVCLAAPDGTVQEIRYTGAEGAI